MLHSFALPPGIGSGLRPLTVALSGLLDYVLLNADTEEPSINKHGLSNADTEGMYISKCRTNC